MKSIITFRGRSIINSGMAWKMSNEKYRRTKMTWCWQMILDALFICCTYNILSSSSSSTFSWSYAVIFSSRPLCALLHTWTVSNTNSIVHRFVSAGLFNSYICNVIMMMLTTKHSEWLEERGQRGIFHEVSLITSAAHIHEYSVNHTAIPL